MGIFFLFMTYLFQCTKKRVLNLVKNVPKEEKVMSTAMKSLAGGFRSVTDGWWRKAQKYVPPSSVCTRPLQLEISKLRLPNTFPSSKSIL